MRDVGIRHEQLPHKLYDNGVVVKHLVPCLRKADGVNGFFDLYNIANTTEQEE